MKNTMTAILIFLFCNVWAQDSKKDEKPKTTSIDYYMMKNSSLLHYRSTGEVETVLTDVSLLNGVVITAKGEIVSADGAKTKLIDGECANTEGKKSDCVDSFPPV